MMKEHKLLHWCQNIEKHNGLQHGYYVDLGQRKLSIRIKDIFRRSSLFIKPCPICGSRNIKVGKIVKRERKNG